VAWPAASAPFFASADSSAAVGRVTGNWPEAASCTSSKPVGLDVNDSSIAVPSIVPVRWSVYFPATVGMKAAP
jgi:hypothetical protein